MKPETHNIPSRNYFVTGQVLLAISLIACLLIIPHYFFSLDQGGVSNYGTEVQTKALYIFGLSGAAVGTLLAGLYLPESTRHRTRLRVYLYLLAIFYLAALLSTFSYKLSGSLQLLHDSVATLLFDVMSLGAVWLRYVLPTDILIKQAFVIFCIGFSFGITTVLGITHVLFLVQIICGVAFGTMLTHAIGQLSR